MEKITRMDAKVAINRILFVIVLFMSVSNGIAQKQGLELRDKIPDIIGKDTSGKNIKLYDLQGKVVLLEFWDPESCDPCEKENKKLVTVYNEYKNRRFKFIGEGFTIFSVALDTNKQQWIDNIKENGLIWPYHIIDLEGRHSKYISIFQISLFPTYYLLDSKGIIIDKGNKIDEIEKTIKNYSKKKSVK